jgi:hypothetical protein
MPLSPNASPQPLVPSAVADADSPPLANCTAELRRLSAHRDDATAIAALAISNQIASVTIITVREYEVIHRAIFAAKCAAVGRAATRAVWAHVYQLSCDTYTDLLWAWRARVRRTRAPVAARPVDDTARGRAGT